MVDGFALLGVGIAAATWTLLEVVAHAMRKSRATQKHLETEGAWHSAANKLHGIYSTNPRQSAARALEARVDNHDVVATEHFIDSPHSRPVTTRITVRCRAPKPFVMEVQRAGLLQGVARAIGGQDVKTGDGTFDSAFVVTSSHPEIARLWLHRKIRHLISSSDYQFSIADQSVIAKRASVTSESRAESLYGAIVAAVALAKGSKRLLQRWQRIARQIGNASVDMADDGLVSMNALVNGRSVTVRMQLGANDVFTLIAAQRVGEVANNAFCIHKAQHDEWPTNLASSLSLPEQQSALVPPGYILRCNNMTASENKLLAIAADLIDDIGPLFIEVEQQASTLGIAGTSINANKLQRAIELVTYLASDRRSKPYR